VVDTTVWVDYLNGVENPQTDFLHAVLDTTPILLGDLILAEVYRVFDTTPTLKKPAVRWGSSCRKAWSTLRWQCKAPEIIASCGKKISPSARQSTV
jgi:hypothetical protein